MITLGDPELERKLRLSRFHGIERDAWKRYGKGGNPQYDILTPGFKYNLTDLQAALGLAQFARIHELNENGGPWPRCICTGSKGSGDWSSRRFRIIFIPTPGTFSSSR